MRRHQLALADRQCRIAELSQRVQDMVVILVASLYASERPDGLVRQAADVLARDLTRRLTGRRPSDADLRAATRLGEAIESGGFEAIAGLEPGEVLMRY